MSEDDKKLIGKILSILLTAAFALLAVFGYDVQVIQPREAGLGTLPPRVESRGVTGFDDLEIDDVTSTGKLIQGSTAVTLTAGLTITPATNVYLISSSGAVSMTLAAPAATGQLLYLYGDDANTVTVNDTNIYTTDGNAVTFGQYDLVEFISVGGKWVHVAKSANS